METKDYLYTAQGIRHLMDRSLEENRTWFSNSNIEYKGDSRVKPIMDTLMIDAIFSGELRSLPFSSNVVVPRVAIDDGILVVRSNADGTHIGLGPEAYDSIEATLDSQTPRLARLGVVA